MKSFLVRDVALDLMVAEAELQQNHRLSTSQYKVALLLWKLCF